MPNPIKTPLGAEVRVFVTTPDTWLVPAGSIMLQMSIQDVGSYRQAEVVLSDENVLDLIDQLRALRRTALSSSETVAARNRLNEERRTTPYDHGHIWHTVGYNAEDVWEECTNCGIKKTEFPFLCPSRGKELDV